MEEKRHSDVEYAASERRSRHRYRRRRRRKHLYSAERQSYNSQELRFMITWAAIAVALMLFLIPLVSSLFESM